eukprot:m.382488 g.382488  ORF g.382488 m.382488 type:complete len:112 (+) comp16721_c1_seq8:865-1200(+)
MIPPHSLRSEDDKRNNNTAARRDTIPQIFFPDRSRIERTEQPPRSRQHPLSPLLALFGQCEHNIVKTDASLKANRVPKGGTLAAHGPPLVPAIHTRITPNLGHLSTDVAMC